MRSLDKFKGCMIGGAAGDALGYAVEFLKEDSIFQKFGPAGITEYENGRGLISDDTQLTLFTAAGLLLGTPEYSAGVFEGYPYFLALSYKDWYGTQTGEYPPKRPSVKLANLPELYSRRAPGNTCLSALEYFGRTGRYGSVSGRVNHSKGCGGVMRVAPIGLYFCDSPFSADESDRLGAEAAAVTHGHSLGFMPAAVLCHIIRRLVEDDAPLFEAVRDSLAAVARLYPSIFHLPHLLNRIEKAVSLVSDPGTEDLDGIRILGEGWVGDEALAIAVFCALRHQNDFEAAVRAAVNHGGDSDSTGAICGSILGAKLGYDAIPEKFKTNLELHDQIAGLAEELWRDENRYLWQHNVDIAPDCGLFAAYRRYFVPGQTYADYKRDVHKILLLGDWHFTPEQVVTRMDLSAELIREGYDEKIAADDVAAEIGDAPR